MFVVLSSKNYRYMFAYAPVIFLCKGNKFYRKHGKHRKISGNLARRGSIVAMDRRTAANDHENWISHSADEGRVPENPARVPRTKFPWQGGRVDRYSRDFAVATSSRLPLFQENRVFTVFPYTKIERENGRREEGKGRLC